MRKVKKLIVSNSNLQSYRKCGMLFLMENVMRLEPREPSIAMSWGTLIHAGLEAHYAGKQISLAEAASPEIRAIESGARYSINHAFNILERYKVFYKDTDKNRRNIKTEKEYTVQVDERIFYNGSIDLDFEDNGLFLEDHKTTSSFYNFIPMAKPNHQATGYIWLKREVDGVLVDGFSFNGINSKVLTFKDPTKLFTRTTTSRNAEEIDEWKANMVKTANDMIRDLEADDFELNDQACNLYGRCKYADVCSLSPSNREVFIKNSFKVKDKAHKFEVEYE